MIKFEDVKKTYKSGVDALKGVSFFIEDGEFVFIIGRSGSGKSTLMKCITREERPTSGKVRIDNFDISNMSRALVPVLRRQIGMIYQDFRLIESKTVSENIAFAGEIIGVPRKSLDQSVNLVLNIVGLGSKADCYPNELSGGEQQRVAIARAMLNNPKLIVADEPTGNLDPETSEAIMALLLEINKNGTTVLICTHDANLVDRMKKRVIEIDGGYIIRDEKASQYHGIADKDKPIEFGGMTLDNEAKYLSKNENFQDAIYASDDEDTIYGGALFGDESVEQPVETIKQIEIIEAIDETELANVSEEEEEEPIEEMKAEELLDFSTASQTADEEPTKLDEDKVKASEDEIIKDDETWIKEIGVDEIDIDLLGSEDD